MADTRTTKPRATRATPDASAQFYAQGYVLSEEADMRVQDLFAAMEAVGDAFGVDQDGSQTNYDLKGGDVAPILRSFATLGRFLLDDAPYAVNASARARSRSIFP